MRSAAVLLCHLLVVLSAAGFVVPSVAVTKFTHGLIGTVLAPGVPAVSTSTACQAILSRSHAKFAHHCDQKKKTPGAAEEGVCRCSVGLLRNLGSTPSIEQICGVNPVRAASAADKIAHGEKCRPYYGSNADL